MSKKAATAAERRYLSAVAEVPCVLCAALGQPGVAAEVHHLRAGQGMAQRSSHYTTAALCPACHRGGLGLHGNRSLLSIAKLTEMDLHALTVKAIFERANA